MRPLHRVLLALLMLMLIAGNGIIAAASDQLTGLPVQIDIDGN